MSYSPNFRGSTSNAPVATTATTYTNGSGGTIGAYNAVSSIGSGQIVLTDPTNEATIETWVGLTMASIPNTASGLVASDGRLENVNSLGFSVGDSLWIGLTPGSLTNVKPDITAPGWVTGDFVLFVGVVVKNQFNPLQQDIQLCRQIIGQL